MCGAVGVTFHNWTRIDRDDPATWPPLREMVMLYAQSSDGAGIRWWHAFWADGNREQVMKNIDYTHWREEMTVDSP